MHTVHEPEGEERIRSHDTLVTKSWKFIQRLTNIKAKQEINRETWST